MTDPEYELMDEIYFVTPYSNLSRILGWEDSRILATLQTLCEKGWIRCFTTPTDELLPAEVDLDQYFKKYYYLASKSGMEAHHGTG